MIDVKKYIESGIIEDYIFGNLSEQDKKEVESLAEVYPEIAKEIDSFRESLSIFAELNETEPPSDLKGNILNSLDFSSEEKKGSKIIGAIDPGEKKGSNLNPYLRYAAIILLTLVTLGTATWAVILNVKIDQKQEKINQLEKQYEEVKKEVEELRLKNHWKDLLSLNSITPSIKQSTPTFKNNPNTIDDPTGYSGDQLKLFINKNIKVSKFSWYFGPDDKSSYLDAVITNNSDYKLQDLVVVIRYLDKENNVMETKAKSLPFDLAPNETKNLDRFFIGFVHESVNMKRAQIFFTNGIISN